MNDVKCPYCGADVEINHDDGYGYDEDEIHQQECPECEKVFVYTTSISISHDASKADCLNGADHKWKPTKAYPKRFIKMRCLGCGEERELTLEESIKIIGDETTPAVEGIIL
jgi:endogenous inhibitor of DNA gyrase (YacG/DUF329 family)